MIMVIGIPPAALLLFNSRMAAFEFVVMSAVLVILGPEKWRSADS
jgi:hypothetical protein